jgi:hypothetical protein
MRGKVEGDESLRLGHQLVCLSKVCLSWQLCQVVTLWSIGSLTVSDLWSPPQNVESTVVSTVLGTSHYCVTILLSICSHDGADLVIDFFQGHLLGTILDHSSLQGKL